MKIIKKIFILVLLVLISLTMFACNYEKNGKDFLDRRISIISREEGSGTRGAFVDLLKIKEEEGGEIIDRTSKEAIIQTKTDAVISTVSGDIASIGYISVGSLNDKIKALKIDGYYPDKDNIKDSSYKLVRPFNLGFKENISDLGEDFIDFIFSKEGQNIVDRNYVSINDDLDLFKSKIPEGKLIIAGSSSVTPVMEELVEEYLRINNKANIEIQLSDSSSGIQAVRDDLADIAMISRELKKSELKDMEALEIALDGIAIIVNKENPLDEISSENVRKLYMGEVENWSEVIGEIESAR